VSPTLFWIFSLSGSSLFLLYGLIRQDVVILIGQSISFYIYVRNLQLKRAWSTIPLFFQLPLLAIPPSILMFWFQQKNVSALEVDTAISLTVVGIAGQLLLNCRYLYQWYSSEKANESVLPLGFWIISLAASIMVVAYSIARQEPVLLVAQSLGIVVYLRNIIIYSRSLPGR
jgi:lipid-A-disaccharide synthase-like uncharacterized protein